MISLAIVGCKKEETTPSQLTITGNWYLSEQHAPSPPSSRTITLNSAGTTTGGTWSMSGNTLTMTRYSTVYTGTLSGSRISGTTVPTGTFTMDKQ